MTKPWPMVPLGEILAERKEVPFPTDIENGSIRIVSKIGFKEGKIELRSGAETKTGMILIRPGDLVVSGINAAKGAIAIYGEENTEPIAATIHYGSYIPNKDRVDVKFLWWLLRSRTFRDLLLEYVPGGIKTELKAKRLLPVPIPLPRIAEQQRIVARIEELAAKIEEAKGLRQKAVEEAEAFLASASDNAFKLRGGWDEAKIGDFCEQPQYGYTASATSDQIGPRLLRITDIQDGKVNWETVPFCHCPTPKQYLLQNDDIVFARTGATTGKSFLIKEAPEAVFASYLIRLRVQKLATVDYLYRYFQTPSYWSQITDTKKGTGQPNVNGTKLANIRVPMAPPEEQRRIVAYLDDLQAKVDSLKRLQAGTAIELNAMLPSVLDRAFKGEM